MARPSYELVACPVCGSSDSAEVASSDDMQRERELLWEFHGRRLRDGVPPERLMDRVAFSQDPPLRLARCRGCEHVYRNPCERQQSLGAAYVDSAPDDATLRELLQTQREAYRAQAERLSEVPGTRGRGLEVGCYAAGFLAAARDRGWMFEGVDISPSVVAFASRNGFTVTCGDIESVVTTSPYDVIAIWNTFEQLPDVKSAVAAARRLLKDGGTFAVRIPNGRFYECWRARLRGPMAPIAERLLVHNNLLTFPYRQGFTSRSLERLLTRGGFRITRVFGDTLVPIADEWTTLLGALDERLVKRMQRLGQRGWHAPWVEVYARAR